MANITTNINVNIPQLDDLKRLIEHLELVIAQTPQANIELEHEPAVKTEVQESKPEELATESNVMSLEEVQKAMYESVKVHGKDKVRAVLDDFGVTKVSAVKPEDRASLAEKLKALGGE